MQPTKPESPRGGLRRNFSMTSEDDRITGMLGLATGSEFGLTSDDDAAYNEEECRDGGVDSAGKARRPRSSHGSSRREPAQRIDEGLEQCEDEKADSEDTADEADARSASRLRSPQRLRGPKRLLQRTKRWALDLPQEVAVDVRKRQELMKQKRIEMQGHLQRTLSSEVFAKRTAKVVSTLKTGRARRIRHKLVFDCSIFDIVMMAFILGRIPGKFYIYYTLKMVWLLGIRLPKWRMEKQHYFLFDFCYFANLVLLVYIWVFPLSALLFEAAAGFAGLLLISIHIFRNSAVLHDFERMTTWYVHAMPSITLWTLRWYAYNDDGLGFVKFPPVDRTILPSLILYAIWAIGYFLNIFVYSKTRIVERGFDTLYKYMALDLGYIKRVPKKLQNHGPIVFMAGHLSLFLVSTPYHKVGYWPQTILLFLALACGIHNGGRYYVDYFWTCYERNAALYLDVAVDAMDEKEARSSDEKKKDT
eukprot:TRINITY_DN121_c0_g1_i1.p1 TRINITY_DN121_c0_g1~~TRINITY_DN121_c0_g1_i1.p1  ORF type:complete len:489 (-),score=103.44 TRINITY_DN121_c0_g1_i1:89-1513(-)